MMSLARGEREYYIHWYVDMGDIEAIFLYAQGNNATGGYYVIEYTLINYNECLAEVNSGL